MLVALRLNETADRMLPECLREAFGRLFKGKIKLDDGWVLYENDNVPTKEWFDGSGNCEDGLKCFLEDYKNRFDFFYEFLSCGEDDPIDNYHDYNCEPKLRIVKKFDFSQLESRRTRIFKAMDDMIKTVQSKSKLPKEIKTLAQWDDFYALCEAWCKNESSATIDADVKALMERLGVEMVEEGIGWRMKP